MIERQADAPREFVTNHAVSLCVLNWNGLRFLDRCLTALFAQTYEDFELILIDNGSHDGSVEHIRANWAHEPRLRLITLPQNTGFAAANNLALARANPAARYFGIINNDTIAHPDWLGTLVAALDAQPDDARIAAVQGALLFLPKNAALPQRGIIASAGIAMHRDGLALDRDIGMPYDFAIARNAPPMPIFGVSGGAALFRRAALADTGFFDDRFFAYLEDADLAWRLRLRGWNALYVPGAAVWHVYSGTGGQGSPFKTYHVARNRVWTLLKNWPAPLVRRHLPAILFYDLAASLYMVVRGRPETLRGRFAALRGADRRAVLAERRVIQAGRVATIAALERWLEPPLSLFASRRLDRRIHDLLEKG